MNKGSLLVAFGRIFTNDRISFYVDNLDGVHGAIRVTHFMYKHDLLGLPIENSNVPPTKTNL